MYYCSCSRLNFYSCIVTIPHRGFNGYLLDFIRLIVWIFGFIGLHLGSWEIGFLDCNTSLEDRNCATQVPFWFQICSSSFPLSSSPRSSLFQIDLKTHLH